MPSDANPLNQNDFEPISGRTVVLFGAVLAALVAVMVPFLAGHGLLVPIAALYMAALVALAIATSPMGRQAVPALALRGVGWKPVVLGPAATILLSVVVSQIGPELDSMKQISELVQNRAALLPSLFVLAVLAPLAEELIFRGLLYGWIEGRWGWKPAFVVSAVSFAAAHFDPTFVYMILVLPLGLLFSFLRWRTNSLLPSLAAHIANNAFAVLSAAYLPGA